MRPARANDFVVITIFLTTEVRGQKSEVGGQRAEGRSQRSEGSRGRS